VIPPTYWVKTRRTSLRRGRRALEQPGIIACQASGCAVAPSPPSLARSLLQVSVAWHRLINHRYWRLSMSWTKPEFEVVELGMEVGAYAGNA